MSNKKPWLNESGCPDPTAYGAMKAMREEERKKRIDKNANLVMVTIRNILYLSGFESMERIKIRHRKSGRIYK
jgi:hypothetical protein